MTSSFNCFSCNDHYCLFCKLEKITMHLDKFSENNIDRAKLFLNSYIEEVLDVNTCLIISDLKFLEIAEEQSKLPFYCNSLPKIKWYQFLSNIIIDFDIQIETLLAMKIYLELFVKLNNFLLIENNLHR